MKRKGEKRVGQNRPKIKKTTYFVLAMICLTIICISPIFIGQWLIQRQAEAEIENKTASSCNCLFEKSWTYNGTARQPSIDSAYGDADGFAFDYTIEGGGFTKANQALASVTGSVESDNDYVESCNSSGALHAGTYICKITDTVTGQIICDKHEFTINPFTITYGTLTLTNYKFKDENATGQVNWTVLGTTYTAEKLSFEAEDFSKKLTTEDTDIAYSQSVTYSIPYSTIQTKVGGTLDAVKNNFIQSSVSSSFKVLPTTYAVSGSDKIFFGSLDSALSYNYGTATTTIVAMQSYTYPGNSTVYSATAATTGAYTHTITGEKTISSNVVLVLPYKTTSNFSANEVMVETDRYAKSPTTTYETKELGKDTTSASVYSFTPVPTCVNEVILSGTLTNEGRIEICGITGHPNNVTSVTPQASTTGNHATLTVQSGAKLEIPDNSTATIEVHGYIVGDGEVVANSGTVTMPFCVYDYNGARVMLGMYAGTADGVSLTDLVGEGKLTSENTNIAPFTIFDMPNIQTKLTCYGGSTGATIAAITGLFTPTTELKYTILGQEINLGTLPAQYNNTGFDIFGDSGALINMTSTEGYIIFEYNKSDDATYNTTYKATYAYKKDGTYIPQTNAQSKITIVGNTSTGDLKMNVTVMEGMSASVSMATIKFPVSSKIALYLDGGGVNKKYTYNFTVDFKFMPGSNLYVQNYAQVTVAKDLLIYKALDSNNRNITQWLDSKNGTITLYKSFYSKFYDYTNDATCEIGTNSTITVSNTGALGGYVKATSSDVTLNLTSAKSLNASEIEGDGGGGGLTIYFYAGPTMSNNTNGYTATNTSNTKTDPLAKKVYTASTVTAADGSYAWKPSTITATLNANGGTIENVSEKAYSLSTVPYATSALDTKVPTRTYYTFDHWCTVQNCTMYKNSEGKCTCTNRPANLYVDTKLYAIWTINTYTLNYQWVMDGTDATLDDLTDGTFNYETPTVTLPSTSNLTVADCEFGGWFTDEACTQSAAGLSGAQLLAITNGNATLYGLWVSERYTLKFENDYFNEISEDNDVLSWTESRLAAATWPTISDAHQTNTGDDKYFDGWYYNGTKIDTANTTVEAFITSNNLAVNTMYTITARWVDKVSITYTANNTSVYTGLITNGSTALTYNTAYWYKSGTSITLPNVTANDAATTDSAKNYYFGSWTEKVGDAAATNFTGTASGSYTLSANTTINITWLAKHKITVNKPTVTNSTITSATLTSGSVTVTVTSAAGTLYVKPTDTVTLSVSAQSNVHSTFKPILTSFNKYYTPITLTASTTTGTTLISKSGNADNSADGFRDRSTSPATASGTCTVAHTADVTITITVTASTP